VDDESTDGMIPPLNLGSAQGSDFHRQIHHHNPFRFIRLDGYIYFG
jgi:hypothetical protein